MAARALDFEDLDRRVEMVVAGVEASVVRWAWAGVGANWETPFELWEQRFGRNPVTRVSKGSPDPLRSVRYGYDEHDRITLARYFTNEGKGPVTSTERVWTVDPDNEPVLLEIEHRWRPEHFAFVRRGIVPEPADRQKPPDAVTTFWRPGSGVVFDQERYDRGIGGRVERITSTSRYDEDHVGGACERTIEYVAIYDELGTLEQVTSRLMADSSSDRGPGEASVQWVRSSAAAVRDAETFLARELPGRITDWVRRNDPKMPVYALGVLYDVEQSAVWVPSLALATVQQLQQIDTQNNPERGDMTWNPAVFPVFDAEPLELSSTEMLAAFRITGQAWGDKFTKKAGTLLKNVAKDVGPPARKALTEPIDAFAAYAVELEDDFAKAAKSAFGTQAYKTISDM